LAAERREIVGSPGRRVLVDTHTDCNRVRGRDQRGLPDVDRRDWGAYPLMKQKRMQLAAGFVEDAVIRNRKKIEWANLGAE